MQKTIKPLLTGSKIKDPIEHTCVAEYLHAESMIFDAAHIQNSTHPHFWLPQEDREAVLIEALYHREATILWALRGGSGTSRLLPKLNHLKPPNKQKTVIGFSDLTALHLFLSQHWGWNPVHAPVIASLAADKIVERDQHILSDLMNKNVIEICFDLSFVGENIQADQTINAPVTGGNLSLLSRSVGTPWQVDTRGKILIIEEVGEPAYKILELLDHLTHAGLFDAVKAIVFGDLGTQDVDCDFHHQFMGDFISALQKRSKAHIFKGAPIGHNRHNQPFQYGRIGAIHLDQNQSFSFKQTLKIEGVKSNTSDASERIENHSMLPP